MPAFQDGTGGGTIALNRVGQTSGNGGTAHDPARTITAWAVPGILTSFLTVNPQ